MLQLPPGTTTELIHDCITVSQELNVEVDVLDRLARDKDVWDVFGQVIGHLRHWYHLQRCADDNAEVDRLTILFREPIKEIIRELFAEERDVWLHNAGLLDTVGALVVAAVFEIISTRL